MRTVIKKQGKTMESVYNQSSELLAYACGVLFCIGMGAIMVGQILTTDVGVLESMSLSMLILADLMLMWISVRGLVQALSQR